MLVMDLTHTLEHFPPPQPSGSAVSLLVTVGKHQEYLMQHGLLPPRNHPGSLDALKVNSPHTATELAHLPAIARMFGGT